MDANIFLFDIDGTLVHSGGAGRRALDRAFLRETGRSDALDFNFGGLTDPLIVRTGLQNAAIEPTAARREALLAAYLEALPEEVAAADTYRVHPGVVELLDRLVREPRGALGLGTGNLERGARVKLERVGLNGYFPFGGFGSDSEDRAELLRMGAERGAARLGRALDACRVVIIGDTPRDVSAAHAIGATCIAVATGPFEREALVAAEPEHLFDDLAADGVWEALVQPEPSE